MKRPFGLVGLAQPFPGLLALFRRPSDPITTWRRRELTENLSFRFYINGLENVAMIQIYRGREYGSECKHELKEAQKQRLIQEV